MPWHSVGTHTNGTNSRNKNTKPFEVLRMYICGTTRTAVKVGQIRSRLRLHYLLCSESCMTLRMNGRE